MSLRQFVLWLDLPIEEVTQDKISDYIDFLLDRRLKPKTINCHLQRIRDFYHYLKEEDEVVMVNPIKKGYTLRTSKPLPKYLRDEEIYLFFKSLKSYRDRAMFMLMLRSGMRVEEVANLTLDAIDLKRRRIVIYDAKWGKDRIVYISNDAIRALVDYLKVRPRLRLRKVFLVQKGTYTGKPISIRGIQKRMEYYAKKTNLKISCHHLRHTMATELLNADAELVTIQDLLGHGWITTTQRYCRVSNLKLQRDYYKAMEVVMQRTANISFSLDVRGKP